MSPNEEKQILRWHGAKESGEIEILLIKTDDERSKDLEIFCGDLARLAPSVRIVKKEGEMGARPAIGVGKGLFYHAIPLAAELLPFLDLLEMAGNGSENEDRLLLSDRVKESLSRVDLPVRLKLYVSQHCPFCPSLVQTLAPFPFAGDRVQLAIIDGTLFPEMAEADDVKAVPTLILDNAFRWTGGVRAEEVAGMIADRDPSRLSPDAIEGIIKEGKAEGVAQMMVDHGRIFDALYELLFHEKWPTRLGAIVTLEYVAEKVPELARQAVENLWERFMISEATLQGDILYMLGEIGDEELLPRLEEILKRPYGSEVRDAAAEAIERIIERIRERSPDQ